MDQTPRAPRKAYTEQLAFFVESSTFVRVETLRRRGIAHDAPAPDRSSVLRWILERGLAVIEGEGAPTGQDAPGSVAA